MILVLFQDHDIRPGPFQRRLRLFFKLGLVQLRNAPRRCPSKHLASFLAHRIGRAAEAIGQVRIIVYKSPSYPTPIEEFHPRSYVIVGLSQTDRSLPQLSQCFTGR